MSDEMTPAGNPTSWRDVYTLVQDVEARLSKRMDDIAATSSGIATDHEIRLRVLERTDDRTASRDSTISKAVGVSRATLLTIMSIGSMCVAILSLIIK